MMKYELSIVKGLVEQLYKKSNFTVVFHVIAGTIIGLVIGINTSEPIILIGSVLIGFFIGHEIGLSKALVYKFQAQMLLTQIEIEKNTHELIEISITTNDINNTIEDIANSQTNNY